MLKNRNACKGDTPVHTKCGAVENGTTMSPIRASDGSGSLSEFCRIDDLVLLFGIRRGTAYGLIREGKIRSITLRKPGRATGVRLVHVASVREFLTALLEQQV